MPAVVTDQFRITNAGNFVDSVLDSSNSYYVFLGLPNPTGVGFGRTSTWNTSTPDPVDNLEYLTHYRDTSLFGKKINSSNIRRVVKKHSWIANERYDMYRHDYSVSNLSPNSQSASLYKSNYYVITSEFKVYICIDNGGFGAPGSTDAKGKQTQIEPSFTDLQPASPGVGDPYTWKYLFTVSPSDVIKFDSTEYIILPNDWSTTTDAQIQAVRESGNSDVNKNQIKKVFIKDKGFGYANRAQPYTCDILGDGEGAKCQVTVVGNEITDIIVTAGGSGYTFGVVDLNPITFNSTPSSSRRANLIPIIPPSKGHGSDIYTELGADKVLVYSRFDDSTKDFPVDTHFAQVGIIKNPTQFDTSNLYTESQFSSLFAMKLTSSFTIDDADDLIGVSIAQTATGTSASAKGIVASYDKDTFVLKYIQDRSLYLNPNTGDNEDYTGVNLNANVLSFQSNTSIVFSGSFSGDGNIDKDFSGISTTIGNKNINLGVDFTNGLANPEINKKTGDIIYIDNRKEVERDIRQKEDVKIILEF